MIRPAPLALALLVAFALGTPSFADDALVAVTGDVIDGRTLSVLGRPAVDDAGVVVFASTWSTSGFNGTGIFLCDEDGACSFVAGTGTKVGSDTLRTVDAPDLNDAGEVVFEATLTTNLSVIVHWDLVTSTGQVLAKRGDTIGGRTLRRLYAPTIDDDGIVVFDDGTMLYEIDLSDGSSQVRLATGTTVDGYRLVLARRADLDDEGNVAFFSVGIDADGERNSALFTTTERLVGQGDAIDGIVLTLADGGGIADDTGPYFAGTYVDGTGTAQGLFSPTEALVLAGDEVAGETIEAVLSARPNAVGQIAFQATVTGGSAVFLRTLATNEPPTADAGGDLVVEATSPAGASVTLDGSGSSDPDDDTLTYAWTWAGASTLPADAVTGAKPSVVLPIGKTTVTLTVDDGNGGTDTDEVVVEVQDTSAPRLALTLDRETLWPPNGRMVDVEIRLGATDAATASDDLSVTCLVGSSEPDVKPLPRWTRCLPGWLRARLAKKLLRYAGDVDGADGYTKPVTVTLTWDATEEAFLGSVALRAERHHPLRIRTYTVEVVVEDPSGNEAGAKAAVRVAFAPRAKQRCKR